MVKVFPNTSQIVNNSIKSPITKGLIKAQSLNAEFFSITNKKIKKGYVTIRELKATLSKFLPSDIKSKSPYVYSKFAWFFIANPLSRFNL